MSVFHLLPYYAQVEEFLYVEQVEKLLIIATKLEIHGETEKMLLYSWLNEVLID
jgi:hypothetical protein